MQLGFKPDAKESTARHRARIILTTGSLGNKRTEEAEEGETDTVQVEDREKATTSEVSANKDGWEIILAAENIEREQSESSETETEETPDRDTATDTAQDKETKGEQVKTRSTEAIEAECLYRTPHPRRSTVGSLQQLATGLLAINRPFTFVLKIRV